MKAWFFVWGLALAALSGSVWSSTGADAAPESLVAGQTVSGHIDLAEYDTYTFDGASNDVAYLMVLRTGGTGTYPRLYLYDPVGALVFDIFTTSNYARIPALRLTRSGTYTVAVSDDRWQESFDYVLAFHWIHGEADPREPGDPPEALEAGKIVEGYLGQADIDTFTFNASSNDVVHYAIVGTNGAGGSLFCYLYNSEGKQVATGNRKTNLTLTNSGTYTLVVLDSAVEGNFITWPPIIWPAAPQRRLSRATAPPCWKRASSHADTSAPRTTIPSRLMRPATM